VCYFFKRNKHIVYTFTIKIQNEVDIKEWKERIQYMVHDIICSPFDIITSNLNNHCSNYDHN